jgi:hypothetical protein
MSLWRLSCDACGFEARAGSGPDGVTGWCEACQRAAPLGSASGAPGSPLCPTCGAALSIGSFRFEELYGELQNLAAVLSAWAGDPAPLAALLPDRPRFLTDLDPPERRPGDDEPTRVALQRLSEGRFGEARQRLEPLVEPAQDPRLWRALAIARERLGDREGAEQALTRALAAEDSPRLRLMRGALRARRADYAGAREDLSRAGSGHEASWNRAAVTVLEAVAGTPGVPDHETLETARAEAGEMSDYWSEPTVGRLLWTLLVERARGRADAAALRQGETELEFDTFWDRALVAQGYAATGLSTEFSRVAAPLAAELLGALASEPALAHPAAHEILAGVVRAREAAEALQPEPARAAVSALLERADLRRYRVPCGACGRGSIGVDALEESAGEG